jgi:hypothetical protein
VPPVEELDDPVEPEVPVLLLEVPALSAPPLVPLDGMVLLPLGLPGTVALVEGEAGLADP